MEILYFFAKTGFYATVFITLAAAILVVTLRNLFHCALALILSLLGVAVTYLYLKAEFLAVIQILLYIGAIMTLLIFAIMLTHRLTDRSVSQTNRQSLPAFVLLTVFNIFFIASLTAAPWKINSASLAAQINTQALGTFLMGPYVFPFEIISIVLIIALVGAVILGRTDQ